MPTGAGLLHRLPGFAALAAATNVASGLNLDNRSCPCMQGRDLEVLQEVYMVDL